MAVDPTSLTPLTGGWSGETFLAEVAGVRQVVRIHARDPRRAEVDAALLRLVRGLVPVPDVLEVRRADPAADLPALLVTSWVEGQRGDVLLPTLGNAERAVVGTRVGDLVATLGGMPMPVFGEFTDDRLTLEPWSLPDGLPGFVADHEAALTHWSDDERTGLAEVAEVAQRLLDTVERRCLVHSDLNPKNWLVDPATLEITALLDWEFAHAGHPFSDLGNALRFEREPAWTDAVLGAYAARRGTPPAKALGLARAADLWALVDLAARRGQNPVADRAHDLLLGIARRRDAGWTLSQTRT